MIKAAFRGATLLIVEILLITVRKSGKVSESILYLSVHKSYKLANIGNKTTGQKSLYHIFVIILRASGYKFMKWSQNLKR